MPATSPGATVEELRLREAELARQLRLFDTALSSIADYVFILRC